MNDDFGNPFPKKLYLEIVDEFEHVHYTELDAASLGQNVATYELVSVGLATVKLVKVKEDAA